MFAWFFRACENQKKEKKMKCEEERIPDIQAKRSRNLTSKNSIRQEYCDECDKYQLLKYFWSTSIQVSYFNTSQNTLEIYVAGQTCKIQNQLKCETFANFIAL